MQDNYKSKVDEYLTSVLSTSYRLPPYDFCNINGYSFLRIRPLISQDQTVMHQASTGMTIIPLMDTSIQMIIIPLSTLYPPEIINKFKRSAS